VIFRSEVAHQYWQDIALLLLAACHRPYEESDGGRVSLIATFWASPATFQETLGGMGATIRKNINAMCH